MHLSWVAHSKTDEGRVNGYGRGWIGVCTCGGVGYFSLVPYYFLAAWLVLFTSQHGCFFFCRRFSHTSLAVALFPFSNRGHGNFSVCASASRQRFNVLPPVSGVSENFGGEVSYEMRAFIKCHNQSRSLLSIKGCPGHRQGFTGLQLKRQPNVWGIGPGQPSTTRVHTVSQDYEVCGQDVRISSPGGKTVRFEKSWRGYKMAVSHSDFQGKSGRSYW